MNKKQTETLKQALNLDISKEKEKKLDIYFSSFLEKNSHTNLISKNDEKFLFEKHVFDSLAINLFFEKYKNKIKTKETDKIKILDIGTGGGFPSVPIAIVFDNLEVIALDSITKKIKLVEELKNELQLKTLIPICNRAENLSKEEGFKPFDLITTRAVASLDKILKIALPLLDKKGYFIAYKSKKYQEELEEAKKTLKKFNAKVIDIIEYTLPTEEIFERNLIVIKKA